MVKKYICKICNNSECDVALKLSDTPLEDQFLRKKKDQPTYALEVALCEKCGYLFLPYLVNPDESYSDYLYHSSVTVGLNGHYDKYAKDIIDSYGIQKGSLIVDLGSNDGSMLSSFKKLGMKVIGVEPASSIAEFANKANLPTICGFFDKKVAQQIIDKHGHASGITANYMFANIDDLKSFCQLVELLLDDDGIFVIQTGYHLRQFENLMFDYIYHEHFSYFTVKSLVELLRHSGLELIEVNEVSPKGGSVRVIAKKMVKARSISSSVASFLAEEERVGIYKKQYFAVLQERMARAREALIEGLAQLRTKQIKVIGFGASHSTTTLIYNFGLSKYIEYIIDDNPAKHGTFSPGLHIPVYSPSQLDHEGDEIAIIILAWQHAESIIQKYQYLLNNGCTFVLPLPEFRVINKHA